MESRCRDEPFAHEFRRAHDVRRIDRLVGAREHEALDTILGRRLNDVLNPENVGLNRFERRSLTDVNMFVSGCMKQDIHSAGFAKQRRQIADIAQDEAYVAMGEVTLFEKHQRTLIVVEPGERSDFEGLNELMDQLSPDGSARPRYHDALAAQVAMD